MLAFVGKGTKFRLKCLVVTHNGGGKKKPYPLQNIFLIIFHVSIVLGPILVTFYPFLCIFFFFFQQRANKLIAWAMHLTLAGTIMVTMNLQNNMELSMHIDFPFTYT